MRQDREALVRWLGEREGTWLYDRARGIDRAPVHAVREAKSVSRDETFATDLDDDAALAARLLSLADRASADVRDAGLLARTVTVKLRDADFTTRQASRTLRSAVESDRVVYAVARELLARLRAARRRPARLLGVALSQFVSADGDGQLSLLDRGEVPFERLLQQVDGVLDPPLGHQGLSEESLRPGHDARRGGAGIRSSPTL